MHWDWHLHLHFQYGFVVQGLNFNIDIIYEACRAEQIWDTSEFNFLKSVVLLTEFWPIYKV